LKPGHSVQNCFLKNSIDQRHTVNFVSSEKVTTVPTKIKIDNEIYMGLIDTGADVSLMSDKFSDRFANKSDPHELTIKEISPGNILSKQKFEANAEITGHQTKLTFYDGPS
jgi:hypothetical protein